MCDIVVYNDMERNVVSMRFRTPIEKVGESWVTFAREVSRQGIHPTGCGIAEYFVEGEFNPNDVEYVLMLPVEGDVTPYGELKTGKIPAGKVASIIHRGEYNTIGKAYEDLYEWIVENGMQATGNCREIYLRCPHNTPDPNGFVTEVQVPVK